MQRMHSGDPAAADHRCLEIEPARPVASLRDDIVRGLLRPPRSLPPKYFYDAHGSQLFDRICTTPEYYPTRVEDKLLQENAANIIAETAPDLMIELGSGTSKKTRRLFDAAEDLNQSFNYAPFDVCEPMLESAADELASRYTWLDITPMLGDYHAGLANFPRDPGTNLFIFLGSTIGNFSIEETDDFIQDLRNCMGTGDYFLIGADRVKDTQVLNAAYNDAEGLTAEFNMNVLRVLNQESGSNFDLNKFRHLAYFDENASQVEMYIESLESQEVIFSEPACRMTLAKGERILTEISRKFTYTEIESHFLSAGFEQVKHYQPENEYFSLLLLRAT